jgi:hypothetical protein
MVKNIKNIAFFATIVLAIGCAGYIIFYPSIRQVLRPPLLKGVSPEIANVEVEVIEFKKRVNAAFPVHTSHEQITQELSSQGFKVDRSLDGRFYAIYYENNFPCNLQWLIIWNHFDEFNHISNLKADYDIVCL